MGWEPSDQIALHEYLVREIYVDVAEAEAEDDFEAERLRRVTQVAYSLAQQRGFAPGNEMDDWFAAEAIVDEEED